jgi:hypothetical protein
MPGSTQRDWNKYNFFLALIATLVIVYLTFRALQVAQNSYDLQRATRTAVDTVGKQVAQVEKLTAAGQLTVTSPAEGTSVGPTEIVSGSTPYPSSKLHYAVVTPLEVGGDWIQDRAVVSGGTWSGRAIFGNADVGVGQRFTVRVLATSVPQTPGPMSSPPPDAVFSKLVTVRRAQ